MIGRLFSLCLLSCFLCAQDIAPSSRPEGGDLQAQWQLAELAMAKGDNVEALRWAQSAAKQGHVEAQVTLAFMLLDGRVGIPDVEGAIAWFERAAQAGDATSHASLGALYFKGAPGLTSDKARALIHFKQAAKLGDVDALYMLAIIYLRGIECEASAPLALEYLHAAAEANHAAAQSLLAGFYFRGEHVPAKPELAKFYYEAAAKQGEAKALYALAQMHRKTDAQAYLSYLDAAAAQSHVQAMFEWGFCQFFSEPDFAVQLMGDAASLGSAEAASLMVFCNLWGWGVPASVEEALYWAGR